MADNTEEEHLENPVNVQLENPPGDTSAIPVKAFILQDQETETMEVHKHPHHVTHKKKWGEYLLEFFMLFLAVFWASWLRIFANTGLKKKEVKSM